MASILNVQNDAFTGYNGFIGTGDHRKIIGNLNGTLWIGLAVGFLGIAGFSLSLHKPFQVLFLSILLSSAAFVCGFFLGFLFGIPKRNVERESTYNLSTNLVDISDWLTKIIIGLGLIEIKKIPTVLEMMGLYIQTKTQSEGAVSVFSSCCLVYFSIFGLYYGYNYMRLFLSSQFKEADDNLLLNQKKLTETKEQLKQFNLSPDNVNEEAKQKVIAYNELLKSTKTEEDYTFDDWYIKGVDAYNRVDYNSTISNMNRAIDKDPNNKRVPDAYLYIGLSFYYLKLYDNAITAYTKILNDYRNYGYLYVALTDRGLCYHQLGMFDLAIKDYDEAISISPSYGNAWAAKGDVLMAQNQYELAKAAYNKALEQTPNDTASLFNRAICYAYNKEKENTISDLKKLIQLDPQYKISISETKAITDLLTPSELNTLIGPVS